MFHGLAPESWADSAAPASSGNGCDGSDPASAGLFLMIPLQGRRVGESLSMSRSCASSNSVEKEHEAWPDSAEGGVLQPTSSESSRLVRLHDVGKGLNSAGVLYDGTRGGVMAWETSDFDRQMSLNLNDT